MTSEVMHERRPEMDAERFDIEAASESRWPKILWWTAVFLVGFIVTELTTHPAVGGVIACSKFGWSDFRNALWLGRNDPHRVRGRVCSRFYIAVGLWKIAFTSLPSAMVYSIISYVLGEIRGRPAANDLSLALIAMFVTAAACFTCSGLLTCWSFFLAVRHRLKIWIDNSVGDARRHDRWPPLGLAPNMAGVLLVSALVPAAFIAVALLAFGVEFVVLEVILDMMFAGKPPDHVVITAIVVPLVLLAIVAMVTVARLRRWVFHRAVATTPVECWLAEAPPEEDGWSWLSRASDRRLF